MRNRISRSPTDYYVLSPYAALERERDHTGTSIIHNTSTGDRISVTPSVIHILDHFRSKSNLRDAFSAFQLVRKSERHKFANILNELLNASIIVPVSEGSHPDTTCQTRDVPLLSIPSITFANCPPRAIGQLVRGDIAIFGVPLDSATTGRPGARFGPEAVRTSSAAFITYERDIFSGRCKGWYYADLGRTILNGQTIADIGDLYVRPDDSLDVVFPRLSHVAGEIFMRHARPVMLGGDHSISEPMITSAARQYDHLCVIHIDAHTDLAPWLPGHPHHHGSVIRRVLGESNVEAVFHFGARGFSGEPVNDSRYHYFPHRCMNDMGNGENLRENLPQSRNCYVTLDVDAIDPFFAPGVGTPVPFGFHPQELRSLLRKIANQNLIVAMDIVELCPPNDRAGTTADLIFHLIIDLIASAWDGLVSAR